MASNTSQQTPISVSASSFDLAGDLPVRRRPIGNTGQTYVFYSTAAAAWRSETLVVTFASWTDTKINESGFGETFLLKNGYDVLCFQKDVMHYYQDLNPEILRELITELRKVYPRIVLYGASLGAYAALYFAKDFQADLVIAFSPRIPLDAKSLTNTSKIRADRKNMPYLHQPLDQRLSPELTTVLCYDPHEMVDREYVNRTILPFMPNMTVWPIRYGGHEAIRVLLEMGLLKPVMQNLLRFGRIPPEISRRAHRHLSPRYMWYLGEACFKRNHLKAAAHLIMRSIEMTLSRGKVRKRYPTLIKALMMTQQRDAAQHAYREAMGFTAADPDLAKKLQDLQAIWPELKG